MTRQYNPQLTARLLMGAATVTARTWPLAARFLPEKLEIDDNHSLWVSQTPDYHPRPPLQETISADLAIIGGGFTGVSTAYHFSRRYPQKRVVLLEAKTLANGASGRNGGMILNWITGVTDHRPEMTARIYRLTSGGIQTVMEIIQRHRLPVSYRLDGTLTVYTHARRAEAAHAEVEYHNRLGIPTRFLPPEMLARQLALRGVCGAVFDPDTGQINGAQFVRALRSVLLEQGVEVYEQTPVLRIREGNIVVLTTPQAEVRAKAIVLATNAYTSKLGYFREALFPLHSHVIATAPLKPEQLQAMGWRAFAAYSDDLDRISYSSLTPEGHIIFGGGSNQSYGYLFNNRTAYPGAPDSAARSFETVRQTMAGYIPDSLDLPIAHRWTGTLALTLNRSPLMGVRGERRNVYYAIGYCGHGVTLANLAGQVLTDLYSGDDERWRELPFYQTRPAPIPPEPFRWLGYQLFTRLTGHSPRV